MEDGPFMPVLHLGYTITTSNTLNVQIKLTLNKVDVLQRVMIFRGGGVPKKLKKLHEILQIKLTV